jgi:hypothetical protein
MMAISIDSKNYLNVEEYNGTIKLVLGYVNKDGQFKPSWCRFGFEHKEGEKGQPYAIRLGDKATAIAILQEALGEINNGPADDGAPF